MRYLVKLRGSRFNKVHIVTGHRLPNSQTELISACGLRWRPRTKAWQEAEVTRLKPIGRLTTGRQGAMWPDLKEVGVTCERCIERGYPPFHRRQGANSVDQHPRRHDGGEHESCRVHPTERG